MERATTADQPCSARATHALSLSSQAPSFARFPRRTLGRCYSVGTFALTVFFAREPLATASLAGSNTVELTGAYGEAKALFDGALHHKARDRRNGLAGLDQKASYLATQFDRVTMPCIAVASLSLCSHPLEEPIHRRTMHGNRALASRLLDRDPLFYLLYHLTLGRLALLSGNR